MTAGGLASDRCVNYYARLLHIPKGLEYFWLLSAFSTDKLTSFWSAWIIETVRQSSKARPRSVTSYLAVSTVKLGPRRNVADSDSYEERDEAYHNSFPLAYAMNSSHPAWSLLPGPAEATPAAACCLLQIRTYRTDEYRPSVLWIAPQLWACCACANNPYGGRGRCSKSVIIIDVENTLH